MSERGFIGREVRLASGETVGRVSDVLTDVETGSVTHVLVERGEEVIELPAAAVTLEPEAEFATFDPDRPEVEPGEGSAAGVGEGSGRRAGELTAKPGDPVEAQTPEDLAREDWEDEADTPPESGYPRNDAYIDPDTGEEISEPALEEPESLADEAAVLLEDTEVEVRDAREGVVELTGAAGSQGDLDQLVSSIMGLPGVRAVETADVRVGGRE